MKVFLDTNVLIAASIRQHPQFEAADNLLQRCANKEDEGVIHSHSLLEFHSAITQLPEGLAVPPGQVYTLLEEGLLPYLRCANLNAKQVRQVQKRAGELGLIGGIIYDLYHLAVAENEKVDKLLTFNVVHFQQLATPEWQSRISRP
jgi:predicted nucleic acid-binding protein